MCDSRQKKSSSTLSSTESDHFLHNAASGMTVLLSGSVAVSVALFRVGFGLLELLAFISATIPVSLFLLFLLWRWQR